MENTTWSESEKKVAREIYTRALERELASILSKFQEMAANAATPADMWDVEHYLKQQRKNVDSKYEYRYSKLLGIFGWLFHEGWIEESELEQLSAEKQASIRRRSDF